MIAILCVDDHNGMMFNHRRQSQDRVLRQRMLELVKGKIFWMNAYSRKQFQKEDAEEIRESEQAFLEAEEGEYCLFEDTDPALYADRIEEVILFHWNRVYPADQYVTLDLSGWTLKECSEFAGSSHEKITEEHYIRA